MLQEGECRGLLASWPWAVAGGGAPTLLLVMALGGKDLSPSLSVSSHNPPRAPFPGNSG